MRFAFPLTALLLTCGTLVGQETPTYIEQMAEPTAPESIAVLLTRDATEALVEVKGAYYLINPHDGSRITSGLLGKRFMAYAMPEGLAWGEKFLGIHQFTIQPRSEETSIFVNGIQYLGSLTIYAVGGRINIVNELTVEEYVKSLLSTEFPNTSDPEVLSALSILTRTDAYYHVARNKDAFWHISTEETPYQGSALIIPESPLTRAVASTRDLILVQRNEGRNLPFAATFTEHCAGKTAAFTSLFRREELSTDHGVESPLAALDRNATKWTYALSTKQLGRILDIGTVTGVELFVDPSSNKVYGIRLKEGTDSVDVDYLTLRDKLGTGHILSSDFTVALKGDTLTFTGYGRGHGVGLCLYSASALSQKGENAVKILSKFFPDTYLLNLSALPTEETR